MTNLFSQVGDTTLPNPRNQHELVLWSLINKHEFSEITIGSFFQKFKTSKLSSRIGELEKDLNVMLVNRKNVPFTNRFSHKSHYVVYEPILPQSEMITLYLELQNNKK